MLPNNHTARQAKNRKRDVKHPRNEGGVYHTGKLGYTPEPVLRPRLQKTQDEAQAVLKRPH